MKDWTLDQLKTFVLLPLAGVVDAATFKLLNAASNTGELIEKLKALPNAEQTMRTVFRKSISVMSYYQSRKRALEYQLAEQELLKSDPNFAKLSEEEKSEKITDQLDNDERYQKHIQPEVETFM